MDKEKIEWTIPGLGLPDWDWEFWKFMTWLIIACFFILNSMFWIVGITTSTDYEIFELNHNQCLQSETFAENECYDIAWKAAFGE